MPQRGRGNQTPRGRGGRGGHASPRGGGRGRGRGGNSRGGSGFNTPNRYDDYENMAPSHHQGLGFHSLGSRGKSSPFAPARSNGYERPLLKPVLFVRGSAQPLLVVDPVEEVVSQPVPAPGPVQHVLTPQAERVQQAELPTASSSARTPSEFQPVSVDPTVPISKLESVSPEVSMEDFVAEQVPSQETTVPTTKANPEPVEDSIVASLLQKALSSSPAPEEPLFFIDSSGSATLPTASTSQDRILGLDDSESEEDQIVYIPPTAQPTTIKTANALPSTHPFQAPSSSDHLINPVVRESMTSNTPNPSTSLRTSDKPESVFLTSLNGAQPEKKPRVNKKRAKRDARKRRKADQRQRKYRVDQSQSFSDDDDQEEFEDDNDVSSLPVGVFGHPLALGGTEVVEPKEEELPAFVRPRGQNSKKAREDAALADYIEQLTRQQLEDEDADVVGMTSFETSVMRKQGGGQMTIGDLEDEQALREYEREREMMGDGDWETDNDEEEADRTGQVMDSDDGSDGSESDESEEEVELEVALEEMELLGESDSASDESESSGDSSDDEDMFVGKNQWEMDMDELEDVDDQIARLLASEPGLLTSSGDRKRRKQLFKAVTSGDFHLFGEDDPIFASGPSRKGTQKQKATMFDSDDEFMHDLQAQWEQDRKRKSQRKKDRLADRLAQNPTKANRKKAKRAGVEVRPTSSVNLKIIHADMVAFLQRPDMPSLSLPPMAKRDRVAVHLLAEAYSLSSDSKGKGANRFPVLQRTARSTLYGVDKAHINRIIGAAENDPEAVASIRYKGGRGRKGALCKELGGFDARPARISPKNRGGEVVGHGAAKLAEDNVGFQLLAKMGWTENTGVGLTQGRHEPLRTVMKVGRGGLGA